MKVRALKNFFMFDGTRIDVNSTYEVKDDIAKDLEQGGFIEVINENKNEKNSENVGPEKKATTRKTTKKKKEEGADD